MTKTKHTPGPWIASNVHPGQWCIMPENHKKMPDMWTLAYVRDFQSNDEANALLIAAAPELLAALLYLRDYVVPIAKFPNDARAAIAKATGA